MEIEKHEFRVNDSSKWYKIHSEWKCYLFGGDGGGFVWNPLQGEEPNWFWRKMQFLCFGFRWVKHPKEKHK